MNSPEVRTIFSTRVVLRLLQEPVHPVTHFLSPEVIVCLTNTAKRRTDHRLHQSEALHIGINFRRILRHKAPAISRDVQPADRSDPDKTSEAKSFHLPDVIMNGSTPRFHSVGGRVPLSDIQE